MDLYFYCVYDLPATKKIADIYIYIYIKLHLAIRKLTFLISNFK